MKYLRFISLAIPLLFASCGEEKEMTIAPEKLTVNEPEIPDSICTTFEIISDYDQHYDDILNTLPAAHPSVADVRGAFHHHIRDSSIEKSKDAMEYRLDHDRIIYMHSKTLPNDLDSIAIIKFYDFPFKMKKDAK